MNNPLTPEQITAMVQSRITEAGYVTPGAGEALENGSAKDEQPPVPRRPLQVDITPFSGSRYLHEYPPAFDWLLEKSLRKSCLGAIVGPPGAGKGSLAIQLCVAVASGTPLVDAWQVTTPGRALYLSAEDDIQTIHRRFHHALEQLPEPGRDAAAENILGVPVHGGVNLCRVSNGTVEPTANFEDLRKLVEVFCPSLLVLDTLARFSGVDENDNPSMTAFCGLLEGIIDEFKCNIILLHHSNKASGDLIEDDKELAKALTQTAMRGASALAGCIRWGMLVAPLGGGLARKRIGDFASGKYDGTFLSVRVGKKNSGSPEPRYYLGRDEHGLLYRVEPDAKQESGDTLWDAHQLGEEVARRQSAGEKPLSFSKGGQEAFGWGITRACRVRDRAIELGLLREAKSPGGRGMILSLPSRSSGSSVGSDITGT